MTIQNLNRQELINNLSDLFGYDAEDFTDQDGKFSVADILNYLMPSQLDELKSYIEAD